MTGKDFSCGDVQAELGFHFKLNVDKIDYCADEHDIWWKDLTPL